MRIKTLALIGKKYVDTILKVNNIKTGETNKCFNVVESPGGMHNFLEADIQGWGMDFLETGAKKAYIVSDRKRSERTSYVSDILPATISTEIIKHINNRSDWLHVCYVDDIEDFSKIKNINIKYSLDFCTDVLRDSFFDVINSAEIVFDSMERKHLYKDKSFSTPLVLHSENGIEIVINGEVIFNESMTPLDNLDVNGAGDIFAAKFIEKYNNLSLHKCAKRAMIETTKILLKRKTKNKNE